MRRSDLVKSIAELRPNLQPEEVERVVDSVFEAITAQLAAGGRVELRGLGVFTTRRRDARMVRDPRTGELISVPGKRVPFFRAGKLILDRLNGRVAS